MHYFCISFNDHSNKYGLLTYIWPQVSSWLPTFVSLKSYLGPKFINTGLPEAATVFPSVGMCEISNSYALHQNSFHPILYRNTKTWCFTFVFKFVRLNWRVLLRFRTVRLRYYELCAKTTFCVFNLPQLVKATLILQNVRLLLFCTSGRNLHFFISFCSSYGGFLNASAKNQIEFTHHRNGRKANPAARDGSHYRRSYAKLLGIVLKLTFSSLV